MPEIQEPLGLANHKFVVPLRDRNVLSRLTLATLLVFALFGALRWAFDVTNVNAKRVSHNLTQMQHRMDASAFAVSEAPRPYRQTTKRRAASPEDAPR